MGEEQESKEKDPYVVTSIKIRRSVRTRAKIYAAARDTTLQEVVESALESYTKEQDQ